MAAAFAWPCGLVASSPELLPASCLRKLPGFYLNNTRSLSLSGTSCTHSSSHHHNRILDPPLLPSIAPSHRKHEQLVPICRAQGRARARAADSHPCIRRPQQSCQRCMQYQTVPRALRRNAVEVDRHRTVLTDGTAHQQRLLPHQPRFVPYDHKSCRKQKKDSNTDCTLQRLLMSSSRHQAVPMSPSRASRASTA